MKFMKMLCVGLLALPCVAAAEVTVYPERPVTLVVPFAAGGPTDLVARLLSEKLAESFGHSDGSEFAAQISQEQTQWKELMSSIEEQSR